MEFLSKLLGRRQNSTGRILGTEPPFPWPQMLVLALCRVVEPIAFMSVFPYTYYMIVSFKITSDDSQIALYAGMITSAFAFAEFTTSVVWGSLSDRIGRKPVLIAGLAGTGVSMMIFGFAPSLPVALLGRAMGGFLNGNIGVIQTTVAELVPTKSHQARAYTIMPFVWSFGSLLGSAIGGTLAQPCDNYPDYFARGTILDKFPFLLPNLVCTAVVVCGVIIGILFLEETHAELKDRRDYGLEAGNWIVSWIKSKRYSDAQFEKEPNSTPEESRSLLEDEQPPGYQTTEGTPKYPLSRAESPRLHPIKSERAIRPPTQKAFTKQVVWTIIGYGILAYHTMSFEQLFPVVSSTPVSSIPPSLPFKFLGGFGWPTKMIGALLSMQGFYSLPTQFFFAPYLTNRMGSLLTWRICVVSFPLLYFLFPYTTLLPGSVKLPIVCFFLIWKVTVGILAYPANAILLTNAAPSTLVLGTINGLAASTASLARAFGPTISGWVHSIGLDMGYAGFAFWTLAVVASIGAVQSFWMEEVEGSDDLPEILNEEAALNEPYVEPHTVQVALNDIRNELLGEAEDDRSHQS